MARRSTNDEYDILIHTDSYAGNFERELRSYVTGCDGDNDTRDLSGDIREAFGVERDGDWTEAEENPFYDLFRYVRGEYGMRIEEIANTPKKYASNGCNTVILHLNQRPTEEQLDILKTWILQFSAKSQEPRDQMNYQTNDPWRHIRPVKILGCELSAKEIKVVQTVTEF